MYFSQFGEDKFLSEMIRDQRLNIPHYVVDIGAADGIFFSNTRHFILSGWGGLLVEPNKEIFPLLQNNYSGIRGVKFLCAAISKENGKAYLKEKQHYTSNQVTTQPTRLEIDCMTWREAAKELPPQQEIGILSIDAEGYDTIILQQVVKQSHPAIVIVEGHSIQCRREQSMFMMNSGYHQIGLFVFNTIWLRCDIAETFIEPFNIIV